MPQVMSWMFFRICELPWKRSSVQCSTDAVSYDRGNPKLTSFSDCFVLTKA